MSRCSAAPDNASSRRSMCISPDPCLPLLLSLAGALAYVSRRRMRGDKGMCIKGIWDPGEGRGQRDVSINCKQMDGRRDECGAWQTRSRASCCLLSLPPCGRVPCLALPLALPCSYRPCPNLPSPSARCRASTCPTFSGCIKCCFRRSAVTPGVSFASLHACFGLRKLHATPQLLSPACLVKFCDKL